MTDTTALAYRKTKSGTWVVFGPAAAIRKLTTVTVTKRSGETKSELIESVGRTFVVDGVPCVYGYPQRTEIRSDGYTSPTGYRRARVEVDHEDCLSVGSCGPTCEYAFIFGTAR